MGGQPFEPGVGSRVEGTAGRAADGVDERQGNLQRSGPNDGTRPVDERQEHVQRRLPNDGTGTVDKRQEHVEHPAPRHTVWQGWSFDLDAFLADPEAWESAKVIVEDSPDGKLRLYGPVWTLDLDSQQTRRLTGTITAGAPGVLAAAGVAAPIIAASIAGAVGYITLVNALGGNRGVEITGVLFRQGVVVTPRLDGGPLEAFVDAARKGFAAATLAQWVIQAAVASPLFANTMGLVGVGQVLSLLTSGTPMGWALAAAAGWAIDLALDEPDPNEHGAVTADRGQAGPWESFLMTQLHGERVTLLSHMGLFSAQACGGSSVYANRPHVGEWEVWTLVDNRDGTCGLRTTNGHYLVAENGGGTICNANRTTMGPWEKFPLEPLPGGRVALRTAGSGRRVSVQP